MIGIPNPHYEELADKSLNLSGEYIGFDVEPYRSALEITRPMEEGVVKDWDAMEKIWAYTFQKFERMDRSRTPLLLTEAPMNPLKNREKMAEIMFEKFGFLALDVQVQATLSLYAMGYMTGLVVDSGDGVTHCIPVSEGVVNKHAIARMNLAGRHLTDQLIKLLLIRGYSFHTSADFETVREIKEKLCYVSCNLSEERKLAKETTVLEEDYKLPDGTWIKVGQERFECGELLFSPYLAGKDSEGLSDMIFKSIMNSPMDLRAGLFNSILLSGGTTMLPGISTRIKKDVTAMHKAMRGGTKSKGIKINVEDPPYRKYLVYLGATALARIMKLSPETWVYKFNWDEEGPRVIHKNR
mmetsp:Transcript_4670/g.4570  ORF Transcript_4670/g.4570 Transcript_4670/m.4570 type:complete len:354 (+) Transcript_4670:85-1146(+)|eukprot:CAMPEP_0202946198 /NCGR_PEP_ID=MMETSP1395-20130829/8948_1 /ASSEMBLY_ACC=CAM_ASM_000871 /TAXON_ID=5961 /ORGANISM="Blepharisma japonicum, Strain Stock R1072" /LENGTH=353 /DNA_ID=CAMNT_0049646659 /DNA_START=86 /DNA_END=1147 /DNA_ORIENTATION=+